MKDIFKEIFTCLIFFVTIYLLIMYLPHKKVEFRKAPVKYQTDEEIKQEILEDLGEQSRLDYIYEQEF